MGMSPSLSASRDVSAAATGSVILTTNTSVYVNSATGNDSNPGTQAQPFQTINRAFTERGKYVVQDCLFTIQLVGIGPYTAPATVGGWAHQGTGVTAIRGDVAARIIHTTGTATGDFTGGTSVLPTSAGMGSDTQKGRYLRFTSGACNGNIFQIIENTDTTITLCSRAGRTAAIATNDTFEIFSPGTVLAGNATFHGMKGGNVLGNQGVLVLENLETSGFSVYLSCTVTLTGCKATGLVALEDSDMFTYVSTSAVGWLGLPTGAYASGGVWFTNTVVTYGANYILGSVVTTGTMTLQHSTMLSVASCGGRFGGTVTVQGPSELLFGLAGGCAVRVDATITLQDGANLRVLYGHANTIAKFAVTSGDCIRLRYGGQASITTTVPTLTGGTTDPAGYAVNVSGGGHFYTTSLPTLTGGTVGKDLKTAFNEGQPNSLLATGGTLEDTQALNVLTVNRTVYVSATGDDANAGTQVAPFKTFDRAAADRSKYIVQDCLYTLQLVGPGPYTAKNVVGWQHQGAGQTAIRGDANPTVHASGTATGDFALCVLPTSTGLGSDTHKGRFLKVTSGACAGLVCLIAENTDTSITIGYRSGRVSMGAVVAGDTFQIVSPTTTVSPAATILYFARMSGNTGASTYPLILENLIFTGSVSFSACDVTPLFVRTASCSLLETKLSTLVGDVSFLGLPTAAYNGAGISVNTLTLNLASVCNATLYSATTLFAGYGQGTIRMFGGRVDGTSTAQDSAYICVGDGGDRSFSRFGSALIANGGKIESNSSGGPGSPACKFAVTSGDCFRAYNHGVILNRAPWTGGTTDPAGYGVNVSGGGSFLTTVAPTVTGGTAGKDLKTSNNGGQPNSSLAVGIVLEDSQYLEVAKAGTLVSSRKRLNLVEGTGVTLTVADDVTNDRANVTIAATQVVLTTDMTVYVDSAAGNDNNAGTQAQPFQTFSRAVTERVRYTVRDCLFTIQLVGAGPYTYPSISGWEHQGSGRTAIRGDASPTVHASGTATGDMVACTLPTSPGLGNDTHRGRWLKMTSGVCAGHIFLVAENADASVTVANQQSRSVTGAIANGDTFQIVSPKTTLSPATSSAPIVGTSGSANYPAVVVLESLTLTGNPQLCNVATPFVRITGQALPLNGSMWTHIGNSTFLGLPVSAYSGVGCSVNSLAAEGQTQILGALHATTFLELSHGTTYVSYGCRIEGTTTVRNSACMLLAENANRNAVRFDSTVTVLGRLDCSAYSVGVPPAMAKFAVTSGDCLKVQYGGVASMRWTFTGGTTDPAGYAVNVSSGGTFTTSVAPTATGGTVDKDLKTTNDAGQPNNILAGGGTLEDPQALTVLSTDRTVYVSATGSDSNAGTQAAPFLTGTRAAAERSKYVLQDCTFTIQLVGAGPFPFPSPIRGWQHQGKANTLIRGDASQFTVHASGTATGNFALTILPTSAGLGVDTQKGRFLRFTSGVFKDFVLLIVENTDTSITVANTQGPVVAGGAVLNGDTFQIVTPGTTFATTSVTFSSMLGQSAYYPIMMENLLFSNTVSFYDCNAVLLFIKSTGTVTVINGLVTTNWSSGSSFGLPAYAYGGVGISVGTVTLNGWTNLYLTVHLTTAFYTGYGTHIVQLYGGRIECATPVDSGTWMTWGIGGNRNFIRFDKTVTVNGARFESLPAPGTPACKFAVTSGDCVRVQGGGRFVNRVAWTGGTTDPAGYAVNVSGGGTFITTVAFPVTGGTPGKDLKTTNNGGQPYSILGSGGTLDDSQYLEVAKTGALVTSRKRLNLIEGTGVSITVADDVANDRANVTITATQEILPVAYTQLQKVVGITAVQLTTTATPVKTQPFLRPEPGSTGIVAVIGTSAQTLAEGMFVGDGIFVPIDDLSKIWLIASAANQKISVIAGI